MNDRPDSDENDLADWVSALMDRAWRSQGFCVPNDEVYPHQWLWDSCFHALVWAELDGDRGGRELSAVLANQAQSGFVPHMTYWTDPGAGADFWGRDLVSTITQPPMYGHALAHLAQLTASDQAALSRQVMTAFNHLLIERQRSPAGLVCVFHPWESGCDDSPRWPGANMAPDQWASEGLEVWRHRKSQMVTDLILDTGTPIDSSRFVVGSVAFSALVAWNGLEAASALDGHPGADELAGAANELAATIADRWSSERATWIDDPVRVVDCDDEEVSAAAQVRTSDALLALLVDPRPEAFDQLVDPTAFGGRFGPTGVHRDETAFDPVAYWRGPAWPQMSYLLWTAAQRAGRDDLAEQLRSALVTGAITSNLAEFWNPDTGQGYGAIPQTWAGLALVADRARCR